MTRDWHGTGKELGFLENRPSLPTSNSNEHRQVREHVFRIEVYCKGDSQSLLEEYCRDLRQIIDKAGLTHKIRHKGSHGRVIDIRNPQDSFKLKVKELKRSYISRSVSHASKWEELLELKYGETSVSLTPKRKLL